MHARSPLPGASLSLTELDALVVGGGPGGSTAAWKLVESGLDVLVVDKASFPRDKPCAGWVTPQVFAERGIDPDDYARGGRTLQRITGFATALVGRAPRTTRWGRTVSWGIRRREFDAYLLERSGAPAETGVAVESLRREGARWIVNERWSAPVLVGAGGHFCPVARELGAKVGSERAVAAQEIEFAMDDRQRAACAVEEEAPELYFCPDLRGYGWCFRKGAYLNVGFGREDRDRLPEKVKAFVTLLADAGRIPRDLPPAWKGHAYLLHPSSPRRVVDDGVLLVGDSAGLAYAESGEGIRTAVESGLLAAKTVLEARRDGAGYAAERLRPYAGALLARFGPRRVSRPARLLPVSLLPKLAGLALKSRWFARRLVLERWFLHAEEPPLAAG